MTQLLLFTPVCPGCREERPEYRRGICRRCYADRGTRGRFQSRQLIYSRGIGTTEGTPPEPTMARPGTPEKLEVMRRRVLAGEAVFHPDDAR